MSLWRTDLTPIDTFIKKYQEMNQKYIYYKTKKDHIFKIKEGVFNFKLNTKNLKCGCLSKNCCIHIIDFLIEKGLSWESIYLIIFDNNVKEYYFKNKDSSNINQEIYQLVDECIICLDNIKSINYRKSFCCKKCNKLIHLDCMNKWIYSKKNNKKCPYCMEPIVI